MSRLLDRFPIGVLIVASGGRIEFANEGVSSLFGYEPGELEGQCVEMLVPELVRGDHVRYRLAYAADPVQRPMGYGRNLHAQRRDGTTFPAEIGLAPRRANGELSILCTIIDITERVRLEAEKDLFFNTLSEKNAEISALYHVSELTRPGAPDAGVFREIAGTIRAALPSCNASGVRIVFDGGRYQDTAFTESVHSLREEILVEGRVRGTLEAFSEVDLEPHSTDARRLLHVFGGMIAEAVERTEAEAKVIHASQLASIGELAAGIGHEVNNPINGIINCTDILLKNSAEGTKERQFLDLIRQESNRIASIVGSLLSFARPARASAPARTSVRGIVDNVLALSNKRLEKSRIVLQMDVADEMPQIRCHPQQIQQVVLNLVLNGMYALDQRYPEADPDKILSISSRQVPVRGVPHVEIVVEDRGIGISPEHRDRIFDPFFSTKEKLGTGLGLSVSLSIVQAHDGWIRLETEPGRFARFIVQLPVSGPQAGA